MTQIITEFSVLSSLLYETLCQFVVNRFFIIIYIES